MKAMEDRFRYLSKGNLLRGAGPAAAIMINDWKWWLAVEDEIHAWMDQHLAKGRMSQKGMVIVFSSDQEMTLFMLKWG